jgi:hypothetical protein
VIYTSISAFHHALINIHPVFIHRLWISHAKESLHSLFVDVIDLSGL